MISKFLNFDTLMQFRVKHILLVSSSYDSYVLEEDGQLTDLIYNEYLELNLTITPHVKRASNAQEALRILRTQSIDMVLIFKRVSDIDVLEFGQKVKELIPGMPIILLAYHERELSAMMTAMYRAEADLCRTDAARIKVHEKLVETLKTHEGLAVRRADAGRMTDWQLDKTRVATLEAQIELERLRLGQRPPTK